jgi:hypothetical protein
MRWWTHVAVVLSGEGPLAGDETLSRCLGHVQSADMRECDCACYQLHSVTASQGYGVTASQPQSLSSQVDRRLTVLHVDPVSGLARKIRLGLLTGRPLVEQLLGAVTFVDDLAEDLSAV